MRNSSYVIPPVFGLGYLRVWRANLDEWREFAGQVLGMMVVQDTDDRMYLRMDDWIARVIVEPGDPPSSEGSPTLVPDVAIGWECRSDDAWAAARRAIEDAGLFPEEASGPTPWCRNAFAVTDPSGFRCEFFYGGRRDPWTQYVSPRAVTFVTGDQGMGHVLIRACECAKSLEFYTTVLGFQVREGMSADDGTLRAAFLSPNAREHSLALASADTSGVGHVMIEVEDLDTVGRAMDRCLDGLAPMTRSIGRHWNDQMVSFYLRTPAGFDIEYGFGGRRVASETWSRGEQGGSGLASTWGHRRMLPDGRLGPHYQRS